MENEIIDYGDAIGKIAVFISAGNIYEARKIAKSMPARIKKKKIENAKYSRNTEGNTDARKYSNNDIMNVLIKDGFVDRYTDLRIVIPPALRVISEIIPNEYPFHPNWAEGKCHDSYWDLSATVDHLKPVANSGTDDPGNLITTSMSKNLQKNSIALEDLGWTVYEKRGADHQWDGLSRFFVEQCDKNPGLLENIYFKKWYKAVKETMFK